jgi:hypothetical protein
MIFPLRQVSNEPGVTQSLTNGARRALVEAAADPITVYPAKVRGRAKFDPDRIKPKWRA